jgi:hypothetical protein
MLRCLATALACALFTITTPFAGTLGNAPVGVGNQSFSEVIADVAGGVSAAAASSGPESPAALDERVEPRTPTARLSATLGASIAGGIGEAIDAVFDGDSKAAWYTPLPRETVCYLIQEVAIENELPEALFARLIWQESKFKPNVVSHVGAQGIAQFMPGTAAERGLEDPFDPVQALPASASFLRDLVEQFGNFGLAAAAYNGGPGRVGRWLEGKGGLPRETRNYVIQITGRTAEHWAKNADEAVPHPEALEVTDCKVRPMRTAIAVARKEERVRKNGHPNVKLANAAQKRKEDGTPTPPKRQPLPWMAVLAGSWSEKTARSLYADLKKKHPTVLKRRTPTVRVAKAAGKKSAPRTTVGIAAVTRSEAQQLCQRMKVAGGACVVRKVPA